MTEPLEKRMLLTTVTSVSPPEQSLNAALNSDVSATLDQDVTAATDQTFILHSSQRGRLTGGDTTVSVAGPTATHDPTDNFFPGEVVQATITSGVTTAGGAANTHVWEFRAGVNGGLGTFADSGQFLGVAASNTRSYGIRLGDLDGDGDLDMFVANENQPSRVYQNDGTGVFADSGQALGGTTARKVELGDVDGDGDLDAVMVSSGGQQNRVWQNDGNGVFTESQTFGGNNSFDVSLGDIDGDGDLDAFVANDSYQANRIYRNDGTGTFSDTGATLGNYRSRSVELGDVDGDGDLDAFVMNFADNARLYLNNGSGTFADTGQTLGDHESNDVALGDLDGDGDLDAITANQVLPDRIWFNDGNGTFTDSGQILVTPPGNAQNRGWEWALGDIDADGDLDGVVAQFNGDAEFVYLNDGNGVFTDSGQRLEQDTNTLGVDMGDVDGDGDLDLVFANDNALPNSNSQTRVFLNNNPSNAVTLSIDNGNIAEAGAVATVTATSLTASANPVTVSLTISGSATLTDDYTVSATEIVIPANQTTGTMTITAVQDSVDEPDETVIVDISGVVGGSEAGTQQVTATILDDDEPIPVPDVTLTVDSDNIAENGGVATFTVNLSEVTTLSVTVDLAISGTAGAGDFNASGTQVVVAPGATTAFITVTAVDDDVDEPDESVIVEVINVTGGSEVGDQEQTTTITDDDEPVTPDVTLTADVTEIAEGGGVSTLTVGLSEVTTVAVTVELGITGTAEADDFNASATQVVIAPGGTTATVTVTSVQDELNEPDETVIVEVTSVVGGNEVGDQQQTITILDDDIPPSFAVTSLETHASGFRLEFASPIDGSELNLFDTQNAEMGPADVVVTGAASGPVSGSLVLEESAVMFIKSGDPLVADTYTVELRSADNGFKDTDGALLDGDGDGTAGGDYVAEFTIDAAPEGARTIQISDFVRGPGQPVNLPANETTGIPISISEGDNVRAVDLRIRYDPTLLEITNATAPGGGTVVLNTTSPGLAILVYFNSSSLPMGESTFIELEASIPAENASENYGKQQVLDVHGVIVGDGNDNEFPAVVDDAVHLATFFSDVSGNGRTNAADASQVARFAALIDAGFIGSLNTDPIMVGDISGNGRINAADASLAARFAALIPVDQIPDIPGGVLITGVPERPGTPRDDGPFVGDDPNRVSTGGQDDHPAEDSALGFTDYLDTIGYVVPRDSTPAGNTDPMNEASVFADLEFDLVNESLADTLATDALASGD